MTSPHLSYSLSLNVTVAGFDQVRAARDRFTASGRLLTGPPHVLPTRDDPRNIRWRALVLLGLMVGILPE